MQWRSFLAASALSGAALLPLGPLQAQLAVQGAAACFEPVVAGAAVAPTAATLAALALAYHRLGCRAAFLTAADRALAAGATGADATTIRALLPVARGQNLDSVSANGLLIARDDSVREGVLADLAWRQYRAGQFSQAGAAFLQLSGFAPGFGSRTDARMMLAQSLLESGAIDSAVTVFRTATDSARTVRGLIDTRLSDGSVDAFARALTTRRAASLLWAPDIRDGRLLMPAPDSSVAGVLRRVQPVYVTRLLDVIGVPAADATMRALLWTPSPAGLSALRLANDSLALADARAARAATRVQLVRGEREGHIADAARYTKLVATVADSLAVTEKQIAAFADSLGRRDAAIAKNIVQYRVTLLDKIAAVRAQAAQNRARIDSVAAVAGRAGNTALLTRTEQATAAEYVTIADAAASALDAGLTRLPILYQRDSIHLKHEALKRSLAAARVVYDSAYRAASVAEGRVAADEDKRLADADGEVRTAAQWRDAAALQVTTTIVVALRARADVLRASLDRALEAGEYGSGAALFFAAINSDTRRAAAIISLTDAVTRRPKSPLRARALVELAELLTRKADADYAAAQRANSTVDHPDYAPAIARYEEFLRDFPNDPETDAAAYTLGSIDFLSLKYEDAIHAFEKVIAVEGSYYRAEALFRHGDSKFELSTKQSGDARRALLVQSAQSYDRALALAPAGGDIYYLALYKLGWSYYGQAERQQSDEYRKAVDIFARLVREIDRLPAERQARLSLRQEAVDYLAIAITQLGGAEEAVRYLAAIPDATTRLLVLRRVARALRDQGEFNNAVIAYHAAINQAPNDPGTLETRVELVDLFQNRMMEPSRAQEARLQLVETTAPGSPWGRANAVRAAAAAAAIAREKALRESGSFALTDARKAAGKPQAPALYAGAAELFGRYMKEFSASDSAQRVSALHAEALFGAGDFFAAGSAYSRTAAQPNGDASLAANARRNATVAFDSALVASRRIGTQSNGPVNESSPARAIRERQIQDSLFAASDRFIAQAPDADARGATIAKGRRAAEGQQWDVVASTFEGFNARWANDPFAAEARKLVGDARYRQGRYADAQREWRVAQTLASQTGRRALADSIVSVRLSAASLYADSLAKAGQYEKAADSVLTAIAGDIGDPARAADALRNAIEVHLLADSLARLKINAAGSLTARTHAVAAIERLAAAYPNYQYTLTYSALRAKLLGDIGRPADAVNALQQLIQSQPIWAGRADAMVRAAGLLDSLGRRADAAAAYEKFSVAYPADKRAADAEYNAAIIYAQVPDASAAARTFAAFATKFPRDSRVSDAQRQRLVQLQAAGDTLAVNSELARLCVKPGDAMAARCADRTGGAAFRDAMVQWEKYVALKLVIATKAQLTRGGVEDASAPKLRLLRTLSAQFGRAIASGAPEWIAAGSYQAALAQWHYGIFLRDVQLPAALTDVQREAATKGSAQQAQAYFDAAIKAWQALIDKAALDKFNNAWVEKARAALKGEGIPAREVTP